MLGRYEDITKVNFTLTEPSQQYHLLSLVYAVSHAQRGARPDGRWRHSHRKSPKSRVG